MKHREITYKHWEKLSVIEILGFIRGKRTTETEENIEM